MSSLDANLALSFDRSAAVARLWSFARCPEVPVWSLRRTDLYQRSLFLGSWFAEVVRTDSLLAPCAAVLCRDPTAVYLRR
jgi:hypothetical protein